MWAVVLGVLFGLVVPFLGVFLGLQVSTALGNILAFPVIAIVYITDTPFGMWSGWQFAVAAVLSVVLWTAFFALIGKLFGR